MTQQTETGAPESSDTLFVLIGVALVALSAAIGGAVLWYTIDVSSLADAVSPAAIATLVFSTVVVLAVTRSTNFISHLTTKNRSGQ